jgi:hypothetical protein
MELSCTRNEHGSRRLQLHRYENRRSVSTAAVGSMYKAVLGLELHIRAPRWSIIPHASLRSTA